jgi:hypothetical protein
MAAPLGQPPLTLALLIATRNDVAIIFSVLALGDLTSINSSVASAYLIVNARGFSPHEMLEQLSAPSDQGPTVIILLAESPLASALDRQELSSQTTSRGWHRTHFSPTPPNPHYPIGRRSDFAPVTSWSVSLLRLEVFTLLPRNLRPKIDGSCFKRHWPTVAGM